MTSGKGRNYLPLIIDKLEEFKEQNPEYSLGQMIYEAFNKISSQEFKKSILVETPDEELYRLLSKAQRRVKNENLEDNF